MTFCSASADLLFKQTMCNFIKQLASCFATIQPLTWRCCASTLSDHTFNLKINFTLLQAERKDSVNAVAQTKKKVILVKLCQP